ncbi:MAG: hypothetical protein KC912_09390 [Proteobacteria bacterium]|nr:hypothetical protein [Pseudomonadota bacterium]
MNLPRTQLNQILESATARGAKSAEVLYEEEQGFEVTVRRGKIEDQGPHRSEILTVRIWDEEGREGEATGPMAMADHLLEVAQSSAITALPDAEGGPIGRLPAHTRGLGIDDRRYAQIEDQDRIDVALDDERAARAADRRVQTGPFVYRDGRTLRGLINTGGVIHEELSTRFRLTGDVAYAGSDIELKDEFASRAYAGVCSLPLGARMARAAKRFASAGQGQAVQGRVLLPPQITARLIALLAPGFTHEALSTGTSVWGKLGSERAMDPRVHVLDDGALSGAWNTWGFDDRGVPPVPLTLIKDGAVDRSFLTIAEARAQATRPSGHQTRDAVGPRNLLVRAGTRSIAAILSEIGGDAFEIEHVFDWSGVDLGTAELDLPIIGSMRTAKGKASPVRGLRLRGNLIAALGKVVDIAGDTDRWRHVDAPGILLDGLELVVAD